jgi:serine/threonine protein kinase/Tol biopolymer transport system component
MTPERWRQVTELFHAVRGRTGADRDALLANACRDDSTLRQEVETLLKGHDAAGSFGDTPVGASAAPLSPGTSFGTYRIDRLIGRGGMGEVYRARDTTLGRNVAIKVLPFALFADPLWRDRLQREARILAALNHPNIGTIYGIEHHGGLHGLVLELVEGPTLADRIARGPMRLGEALHIGRQIAEALEAAHEQGIVHRDIKPSNIALAQDDVVKVLDFGLAKTIAGDALAGGATHAPIVVAMTDEGTVAGTATYMSPEQARGQAVDRRTDIWAFGCVLFETLTGWEVFGRETRSETIAAVLEHDPPWDRLPAATPQRIRELLRRCLEKDPKRRLRDIGDARFDLDDIRESPRTTADPAPRQRAALVAASALAIALVGASLFLARGYGRGADVGEGPSVRFTVTPEEGVAFSVPSLSPDGRRLAFISRRNGVSLAWVRSLDSTDAQPVAGSEDTRATFWSPDGRSLAFLTGREALKIVDDFGRGHVRQLGNAVGGGYGMMWCPDGRIVTGSVVRGLVAQSPDGGSQPTQLRTFDLAHGEGGQLFPTMLPDGRHYLYLSEPSSDIYVASLESNETTRLLSTDSQALYVPPGYLLFVRRQTLFAQRFDLNRLQVVGEPVSIAEGVMTESSYGADFTAASNGVLAYRTGTVHLPTQLTWVDRTGKRLGTVGPPGRYANIELSSDGTQVAMEVLDPRTYTKDIWTMDLARGVLTQVTFDPNNETFPIWSPDGRWIMFGSDREGGWQLYERRADGVGGDERVANMPGAVVPQNWAPDGRLVVYLQRPANLGVLQLVGPRPPGLIESKRSEGFGRLDGYGQVSPDGHWLLYGSNESGRYEIYVRQFPERESRKWKISEGYAISPRWRSDGHEIFYYSRVEAEPPTISGQIVAVPIAMGAMPTIGTPVPLFNARLLGGSVGTILWRMQYAVSNDGKRFLLNEQIQEETAYARAPIVVVTNWMAALKK